MESGCWPPLATPLAHRGSTAGFAAGPHLRTLPGRWHRRHTRPLAGEDGGHQPPQPIRGSSPLQTPVPTALTGATGRQSLLGPGKGTRESGGSPGANTSRPPRDPGRLCAQTRPGKGRKGSPAIFARRLSTDVGARICGPRKQEAELGGSQRPRREVVGGRLGGAPKSRAPGLIRQELRCAALGGRRFLPAARRRRPRPEKPPPGPRLSRGGQRGAALPLPRRAGIGRAFRAGGARERKGGGRLWHGAAAAAAPETPSRALGQGGAPAASAREAPRREAGPAVSERASLNLGARGPADSAGLDPRRVFPRPEQALLALQIKRSREPGRRGLSPCGGGPGEGAADCAFLEAPRSPGCWEGPTSPSRHAEACSKPPSPPHQSLAGPR